MKLINNKRQINTSWQKAGKWYQEIVGLTGHYYHRHIIIPGVLRLLNLTSTSSLLDLACGQGVLAGYLPKTVYYQGVDLAGNLIDFAKKQDKNPNHHYLLSDVTKPLPIERINFTHATIILALQNIEKPEIVLSNANKHLIAGGKLIIVINHPCFRIPRQSSWGIDEASKLQYRRINRYLSPLKIPVRTNPGMGEKSPILWSFHYSISSISQSLFNSGFMIEKIEEWASDKESVGKAARMENRGRSEFPLFMAICAIKKYNTDLLTNND